MVSRGTSVRRSRVVVFRGTTRAGKLSAAPASCRSQSRRKQLVARSICLAERVSDYGAEDRQSHAEEKCGARLVRRRDQQ